MRDYQYDHAHLRSPDTDDVMAIADGGRLQNRCGTEPIR